MCSSTGEKYCSRTWPLPPTDSAVDENHFVLLYYNIVVIHTRSRVGSGLVTTFNAMFDKVIWRRKYYLTNHRLMTIKSTVCPLGLWSAEIFRPDLCNAREFITFYNKLLILQASLKTVTNSLTRQRSTMNSSIDLVSDLFTYFLILVDQSSKKMWTTF